MSSKLGNGLKFQVMPPRRGQPIATCAGEYSEDDRQNALLVTNMADSGEKIEYVVFGWAMPENEDDFSDMCEDSVAWDSDCETLETVKFRSF